jgi:hypothetical protein
MKVYKINEKYSPALIIRGNTYGPDELISAHITGATEEFLERVAADGMIVPIQAPKPTKEDVAEFARQPALIKSDKETVK